MATMPQLGARRIARDTRGIATVDLSAEGRAMEGFGNTALKASEDIVKQQKQEEDAAAVFSARRKLDDWERSNLYDAQNGAVAKMGQDAFDLPTTIPKSFDDFAGKLGEGVTSPRARTAIQEMLVSRREQATKFVDRHAFQQRQVFEEGQFKADIDSSLNRAALLMDAGDANTSAAEVKLAQTRAVGFLKARGKSEEEIASVTRDISSKAAVSTINLLLDKDKPTDAETFLRNNAGAMKTEDMLRAQAAVGKAVDARQGLVVAQTVVDRTLKPAIAPTDFGRLANLAGEPNADMLTAAVMKAESGGKRFGTDGKILTSSKGAKGEMQVLDSTNKDPGFGVVPAKDNSPDERARVGRDYLQAMLREFPDDYRKGLAAYNAGAARVQEAIKAGGDAWLEKMPDETKAYVAKISKSFGDGGGTPTLPTLQSLHEQVRQAIPPDQPQRRKTALDEVTRQYEETLKAKKQGEDDNIARGYEWLDKNGGRFSQMPANLRANIPAKDYDNMRNYGVRVAKGDDITNPVVFQKMATDDAWLKGLTDGQFYMHSRDLSQADQQQMALRRGALLNKNTAPGQKHSDLDANGVNAILNNRLQQLGMDPTPKDGGSDAQRVGAIRKFVWDGVLQAQQAAGKKFSDAEMSATIDKMFATNVTFQNTFMGMNTSKESKRLLGMSAGDIPGEVKARLEKDFAAHGISKPTEADLLGAYFQLRGSR